VAPLVLLAAAARARPVTTGGHIHLCSFAAELRLNDDSGNALHVRTSRAPTDINYWNGAPLTPILDM